MEIQFERNGTASVRLGGTRRECVMEALVFAERLGPRPWNGAAERSTRPTTPSDLAIEPDIERFGLTPRWLVGLGNRIGFEGTIRERASSGRSFQVDPHPAHRNSQGGLRPFDRRRPRIEILDRVGLARVDRVGRRRIDLRRQRRRHKGTRRTRERAHNRDGAPKNCSNLIHGPPRLRGLFHIRRHDATGARFRGPH